MLARPMARLAARAIIILSAVTLAATPAQAGTSSEQKLADRYAPIVVFREQKKSCGSGEPYRPIALEGVLGNDEIVLRGADHAAAKTAPTAADLYGKGEGYYLDLPGNPLSPGCTYEREARRWNGDR